MREWLYCKSKYYAHSFTSRNGFTATGNQDFLYSLFFFFSPFFNVWTLGRENRTIFSNFFRLKEKQTWSWLKVKLESDLIRQHFECIWETSTNMRIEIHFLKFLIYNEFIFTTTRSINCLIFLCHSHLFSTYRESAGIHFLRA